MQKGTRGKYDSSIGEKANSVFARRMREMVSDTETTKGLRENLGVSQQAINQYKNGTLLPKTENLIKIAEYLGVSLDYMTGISDVPVRADKYLQNEDYIGGIGRFLELTGLTTDAYLRIVLENSTKGESAGIDVLNLLIEHQYIRQFLDDMEFAVTRIMYGASDRDADIAEAMLAYDLRRMIPDIASEFKDRGYLTTEQRMAKLAEEGADNGKL